MKKILPLLLAVSAISESCCIVHKTFAQSDRLDTHRPTFPVVECIPCNGLRNVNENFISTETFGPAGSFAVGYEMGHNFNCMRIYGSGTISYWPFRLPNSTFTAQLGIVGLNPDLPIRPEIGIGISDWNVKGNKDGSVAPLHPSMQTALVGKGNYSAWEMYGGLKIAIPRSNIDLSLRIYKLETIKPKTYDSWYPGFVCGFRF